MMQVLAGARAARIALSCMMSFGVIAGAPAEASFWSLDFDTNSAQTMQGLISYGPNRQCNTSDDSEETFPYAAGYQWRNGNPNEPHLYQAYTLYNNGPERCVDVRAHWIQQDCGDLEIGIGLYLGSFNPADPTENLLAHSYEKAWDFFDQDPKPNQYRYSPGYFRQLGFEYHLDYHTFASAVVPALSTVVVVLDSTSQPGDDRQCPIDPATAVFGFTTENLSEEPLAITVSDTSSYEYNPPGGAFLDFYVSLSTQFNEPFTVDFATSSPAGPGIAQAGVDYTVTNGQLTFQPGETFKIVKVPIVSDIDDETPPGEETMLLTLANPSSPFVALGDAQATGTIYDDDDTAGLCKITNYIGGGDLPMGKVGQPYGPIDLRGWSASFDFTLEYDWSTLGGTLPPGVALFEVPVEDPVGSGNQEIHGSLAGTPTAAGTYTFGVHLVCPVDDPDPGSPPPETYDAQFTIIIEPEDPQAILTLEDVVLPEGNVGLTPAVLQMHLSQALTTAVDLEVVVFDASATVSDNDYQAVNGGNPQPTVIASGLTSEAFDVQIVGDTEVEADEVFLVQLRTPIEKKVLAVASVTIVNDDVALGVTEIPTLGEWGLIALGSGLAGIGLRRVRRRREGAARPR